MTTTTSLPEIKGSVKQVAWATSIRDRLLSELDRVDVTRGYFADTHADVLARARKWIVEPAYSAGWWIDRRQYTGKSLLLEMVRLMEGRKVYFDTF